MSWLAFGVVFSILAQPDRGDPPLFGGPCDYVDTPGVATIVSVSAADPGDLNCSNDPVVVNFDFLPDDPAQAGLAALGVRLRISEGVNPPRAWTEAEGLVTGSLHPCVRRDISSGTCTPLLFVLSDVDYEAGIAQCYEAITFAMDVFPLEVVDAIYDQRIVILTAVEDYGFAPSPDPVHITVAVKPTSADVTVAPADIRPGQVCEITVIPRKHLRRSFTATERGGPRGPWGEGDIFLVDIQGERQGFCQSHAASINVLPGEDSLFETAAAVRDRFIPFLASQHPELGITADTVWTPTIVKPHIWIVSHYLFFSDEWEMGVEWHITIAPWDWGRIYLRHRYTEYTPSQAFEISSLSTEPPLGPHTIPPPEQVDR